MDITVYSKVGVGEEGAQDKDDIHALIADAVVHLSGDVWLISSNPWAAQAAGLDLSLSSLTMWNAR